MPDCYHFHSRRRIIARRNDASRHRSFGIPATQLRRATRNGYRYDNDPILAVIPRLRHCEISDERIDRLKKSGEARRATRMDDKRSKGVAKFKQMSPKGEEMIRTLLEDTAPGTYHQILEVAFGDLYQRANLDPKIRQTVSLVALAAGGHENELRIHIDIARRLGFTKDELSEVFQQCAPFTGFPAPMLGIRLLKESFAQG